MKRIITILGARAQLIQASLVSRQLRLNDVNEKTIQVVTDSDYNMSEIFFEELEITRPDFQIHCRLQKHGAATAKLLESIEAILISEKPEGVLVYGGDNASLAGALAAAKLFIPVIHIEAGLRSFGAKLPEEINRIVIDRISKLLFCPTDEARQNLSNEGMERSSAKIIQSGDVFLDAFIQFSDQARLRSDIIRRTGLKRFVLASLHRHENVENRENFRTIIKALNELNKIIPVVMPVHPVTRSILAHDYNLPEFMLIEPVGYLDMIMLLRQCDMVVTDSITVQKEAYFAAKQSIILRDETEWNGLTKNGYSVLTGSDCKTINAIYNQLQPVTSDFDLSMFGNGRASSIIAKEIARM
jgi:UDP-GlcNAc3NAcA epimerase